MFLKYVFFFFWLMENMLLQCRFTKTKYIAMGEGAKEEAVCVHWLIAELGIIKVVFSYIVIVSLHHVWLKIKCIMLIRLHHISSTLAVIKRNFGSFLKKIEPISLQFFSILEFNSRLWQITIVKREYMNI